MKKLVNVSLLLTFILTIMAPLTGVIVHKLVSTLFLLLCLLHTFMYIKTLNAKKYAALGLVVIAFVSGIFGMIYDEISWILAAHKVVSIGVVFVLAIHIYVFHRKFK